MNSDRVKIYAGPRLMAASADQLSKLDLVTVQQKL